MFATAAFPLLFAEQVDLGANTLTGLMVALSQVVSGIGVVLIAWGTYSFLLRLIATETAAARGQLSKTDTLAGRAAFAGYLLPALDFMVAGCLVRTFAVPDWQQAALLASLVFARALITLSLRWGVTPAPELTALPPAADPLAVPVPLPHSAVSATADGVAPVGAHAAP